MKAHGRLRLQDQMLVLIAAFNAELLDRDRRCLLQTSVPLLRREVKVFRSHQIADQTALVRLR